MTDLLIGGWSADDEAVAAATVCAAWCWTRAAVRATAKSAAAAMVHCVLFKFSFMAVFLPFGLIRV
jgi:hypothetical protein